MTEFTDIFQYLCLEERQRKGKKKTKKKKKKSNYSELSCLKSQFRLTADIWWCPSPPSSLSPARAANRYYKGLPTIEVLIDAILMLSIIINYNNLRHVHRGVGTKQRLVIEMVQWQLKHLWLAAACKWLEMGIYINKGFPLVRVVCVSHRGCWSLF